MIIGILLIKIFVVLAISFISLVFFVGGFEIILADPAVYCEKKKSIIKSKNRAIKLISVLNKIKSK